MKKNYHEYSNTEGLSRTCYNGYQPINDPSKQIVDWSRAPTSGSNVIKPTFNLPQTYEIYRTCFNDDKVNNRIQNLKDTIRMKNIEIQYLESELSKEKTLRQSAESHIDTLERIIDKLNNRCCKVKVKRYEN